MARRYYVYILTNRSRTLYVGVTNDIVRRLAQHRSRTASAFTRRYMVRRLVYVEDASYVRDAIAREKEIKRWSRSKKLALINAANPQWLDLAAGWFDDAPANESRPFPALGMTPLDRDDEDSSLRSE